MAYVLTVLNCLFSILYSYFPPRKNKQAQSDDSFKAGNRQLPEGAAFLAKCETDLKKHQRTCFATSRVPLRGRPLRKCINFLVSEGLHEYLGTPSAL
jgi:hypothetical protein